jgi:hypothetical protein
MVDHAPSSGILDRWGLLRPNGTTRPAFRAFQVATRYLADPSAVSQLAPVGLPDLDGWPVTRVVLDNPAERTRVQALWRTAAGPSSVRVEAVGSAAQLVDVLGGTRAAARIGDEWDVPLPPPRVPQDFDPPGFQSVGYPVLLVEQGLPAGRILQPAVVTSPLMALAPAVLEAPRPIEATRPPIVAPPVPVVAATQPRPALVLTVSNPQPNDLLPRARLAMEGRAFDRSAASGSGIDKVSVFLDDRDGGGQLIGDAMLGKPNAAAWNATADFSRASPGKHTLFVYARSSLSGGETSVSLPINVANR